MLKERQSSMAEMPEPTPDGSRRNRREYGGGVSNGTAGRENSHPETECLMEEVVEEENMLRAYRLKLGMFCLLDTHSVNHAIS